tara:strand:+ start:1472 stop:1765 length:294 start_codon:yes stop_codon:yes gene_type:complete
MTDTLAENEIISTDDGNPVPLKNMPRHEASNPLNHDPLTLARREKEISAIIKDYPKENPASIQMAWDFVYLQGSDEAAMREVKRLEKLPPKPRDLVN